MSIARIAGFFDPRGRLSQSAYGRFVVRLLLVSMALFCAAIAFGAQGWRESAFAALACAGVPWLASLAQTIRRLHDRDRTGWWLSLPTGLAVLSFVPVEMQADAYPVAVVAYALATLAAWLWFLLETLGRRSSPGTNRYGAEPGDH